MITRRQLFKGLGAAAVGGIGFGGYALAEPFGTSVTPYHLSPPGWPTGLSLKLAVIADLHACKPWMDVERIEGIVAHVNSLGPDCVLLLGSNVGNFDRPAADAFIRNIRDALRPGDLLLLGADLVKPQRDLLLAYDDPLGVTAAFNKNLLVRVNRELGADFDLGAFRHRAVWNHVERRIEMHLVSCADQRVRIPAASASVDFRRDEWIWTESSYKYTAEQVNRMGAQAGLVDVARWIEDDARFALTLFRAV